MAPPTCMSFISTCQYGHEYIALVFLFSGKVHVYMEQWSTLQYTSSLVHYMYLHVHVYKLQSTGGLAQIRCVQKIQCRYMYWYCTYIQTVQCNLIITNLLDTTKSLYTCSITKSRCAQVRDNSITKSLQVSY